MRTRYFIYGIIILLLILFNSSCKRGRGKIILTQQIQYDVNIKSPDSDMDWWVQNIERPERVSFIKMLLFAAYSGKIKAYDAYFNTPLTVKQLKSIGNSVDSVTLQRPYPPYEYYDTIVKRQLDINQITRIRFLEKWYINKKTFEINKKIIGIAPIIKNYNTQGNFRGYMPLFWLYFDNKYPKKLLQDSNFTK